ncbi:TA system VapC family ribonuclease toxin [Hydrogenophaga sp. OTU3427]|uniref:TA system VapC family ribonuclease toxin n=1 Tax=Hydrogenophaga sp. OTU3427 TaxID=3043856 RepID=UPI00313D0784
MSELKTTRQHTAEPPAAWLTDTTPPLQGDLPDLNVWLALVMPEHPHHGAARQYWDGMAEAMARGQRLCFCRPTMMGLVRLLSQPKLMGDGALSLVQAHGVYRELRAQPGVAFVPDHESADAVLPKLLAPEPPPRLWTDAWLAATAQAAGLRLVSFDADFARFQLPRWTQLRP